MFTTVFVLLKNYIKRKTLRKGSIGIPVDRWSFQVYIFYSGSIAVRTIDPSYLDWHIMSQCDVTVTHHVYGAFRAKSAFIFFIFSLKLYDIRGYPRSSLKKIRVLVNFNVNTLHDPLTDS